MGHLGPFQLLAIINEAAMNIVVHVSLFYVRASFQYMPGSGIVGYLCSNTSDILRKSHTDF